jgi:hypothetical protein
MQKSLFRGYLTAVIVLSSSVTVVSAKAVSIPQIMGQRMPSEILLAQSAVDEDSNLKFEPRGCRRTKATQVICDVLITNLGNTRQGMKFGVYGNATNAIDSSGTVYGAKRVQSGESFADINGSNGTVCGCFSISIAAGIPTKVTFTFEIPQEVTELAALDVDFASSSGGKRIAISNIGTIATQSNSAPPRQRVRPR